ncbi:MAG: hypothetical protein QF808_09840 [Thalassolituus sp.]|uniref:hypothetical protein n=1 Tax=Thalassolituus sp. UBA3500 TaxID=1947664 RepID=UPI000C114AB4|nr:hypothetical protein [Thalassolituus sp. UBA3500]MBN59343.1 hypothetical protein [Oceanospirillaceae bacterium]MDQ4424201.1 hypothetical protein [Thalassolituus sp.]|tara:strand:+ start:903 stop:2261 length:1359 start_codon:yes stop_codon:yes gene_type:complete
MKYCKYHPTEAATWYCTHCDCQVCDTCTQESERGDDRYCCKCGATLESLGSAYTAEPFWERLSETFRYPLTVPVMTLIIILSAISGVLFFMPIVGAVAGLISAGILTKYSFQCLEETASGNMSPPGLSEAFSGGIIIIFKMIGLIILITAGGVGSYHYLGAGITGLLGAFVVLSIPAFLINFALTDRVLASFAPQNILRIVGAVGLPYGILIGLLLLMSSSVGLLSYMVFSGFEWASMILQSVISNFYMVVIFHLLGYVVFQYQEKLGFYARAQTGDAPVYRSEVERSRAKISVLVKEGDYEAVNRLYQKTLDRNGQDMSLNDEYFEFLMATGNKESLLEFADEYMSYKLHKGQQVQLKRIYNQVRSVITDFKPTGSEVRFTLAKDYASFGDYPAVVRLINGMHQECSDNQLLVDAYTLLREALEALGRDSMVRSCDQYLIRLKRNVSVGSI